MRKKRYGKEDKIKDRIMMKELAEGERPREKLLKYGVKYLSNVELLAILIGTGAKERSALILAESVLAMGQGGISSLGDCGPQELYDVKGIGAAKACRLVAAIEIGKRIATAPRQPKVQISNPAEIADLFMEEMRYEKKEYFKILLLNTKNEIIAIENIAIGSLSAAVVHPREVFLSAVKKSASAMIAVHNHPSGSPAPSPEDLKTTTRLVETGKIIGITLLDHLIIGDGTYVSLKEQGLM